MKQLSTKFEDLWFNQTRSLNIGEYEECLDEWQSGYFKGSRKIAVVSILLFCAGLWALYVQAIFMTVLLLALTVYFQLLEQSYVVLYEIMNQNKLLAMLINRQSTEQTTVSD